MGYFTDHKLSIYRGSIDRDEEDFILLLEEITGYDDGGWEWEEDGWFLREAKWYNHKQNMLSLSKYYPNTTFKLEGVGEDHGDVWMEYWKNGKNILLRPKMVWPEFREEILE